ncbi:hypothetical protein PGUG_01961 [Meyerozyma guilliermondii ATCC 6260]|uniref:Zn(2)-C6 fungal-type domain-containing protein n=1 Tax=Meyerozyma guilliermondii (strain ATCC 6260 / CBS 566 / DSM 6381 / JCM 1539 / NBRC 10279 / NRRL Y-324) TaxID=294746 RepID=A5DFB0_PICGU|nr:uncharacterized protein PGUG_01961 [Meyerozyma guilliermondii ATCC 6260]EDK37863.2 hypothetical protein PGUG_01961 [Meyerozyma guilliermondii ATCC 6260]
MSKAQEKATKRRRHKNSKFGCPNCKKRRVKCSEDLPSCLNCIKHKTRCGYLDYTEEQLDELRAAKASLVASATSTSTGSKSELAEIDLKQLTLSRHESRGSYASSKVSPPAIKVDSPANSGSGDSFDSNPAANEPDQEPSPPQDHPVEEIGNGSVMDLDQDFDQTHFLSAKNYTLDSGVNDVFNFQAQHVTQDFDNIMSAENFEGQPIIYPVYSIHNSAGISRDSSSTPANSSFRPTRDIFNLSALGYESSSFVNDSGYDTMELDTYDKLPNAMIHPVSFEKKPRTRVDYEKGLYTFLFSVGASIANGTCPLPDIRHLFHLWLNYFISMSIRSEMMFSCLLNLTTNYLISNCLNPNQRTVAGFTELVDRTKQNNALIIVSIKHYAKVIKDLRDFLNKNEDPETCSTVSYILSLMSIYDPEATLNSINCFRDGLFSVLSYNLNLAAKNGAKAPTLIPAHMQLMINIERSVYHPSYDPTFLNEFREKYIRFGEILRSVNSNTSLTQMLTSKYNELYSFLNLVIDNIIEEISGSYDNVEHQQKILFKLMQKWAISYPIRFSVVNASSDPLEKILALFYKVFKKALYSIFPQVKYFFLRDFDSPLMLDVVITRSDFEIFKSEIDQPSNLCCNPDLYDVHKHELKSLSGYLIRLVTFLQKRIMIIYRMAVQEDSKKLFPITDVRKWRASITDISRVRSDFAAALSLSEVPVTSFTTTLLKPHHYPRRSAEQLQPEHTYDEVDFLTLKPNCLLDADFDPFLQ